MKLWMLAAILVCSVLAAHAEEQGEQGIAEKPAAAELPQWVRNIQLSGYGMLQ